jgi:hypothetical protein
MDSTPFSQTHSFSGGSVDEHPLRVPSRKQFTSPNNLQNSVGDAVGRGVVGAGVTGAGNVGAGVNGGVQ